jgi:hypothetical protein
MRKKHRKMIKGEEKRERDNFKLEIDEANTFKLFLQRLKHPFK